MAISNGMYKAMVNAQATTVDDLSSSSQGAGMDPDAIDESQTLPIQSSNIGTSKWIESGSGRGKGTGGGGDSEMA
mgnify:CR=1 FL=1